QLCDVLERLVLDSASCNLLTLDQTDPDNMSDFCIGQIELQRLRLSVTMFRYCKPTPYLARFNTGVFKRMRWNWLSSPPSYYLCCEDTPNIHADSDKYDITVVRMWSIGQWVQVKPDPNTESIVDWVLCDVPEGDFEKLLFLGEQEPSSHRATDQLLKLLMSQEGISPHPGGPQSPLQVL
uniref:Uncharacterized protein n=1 Tax=Hippocampus comes TaxID=109280 RepID=A0A3Q2YCE2_HIPCM